MCFNYDRKVCRFLRCTFKEYVSININMFVFLILEFYKVCIELWSKFFRFLILI